MTIVENMIKRSKASGRPAADAPADKARAGEPQQAGSKLEGRGPKIELEMGTLRALNLAPAAEFHRQHLDEFRAVKRPLMKNIRSIRQAEGLPDVSERVVLVSSALPGDGKTYVSLNLAMSIAGEKDFDVLLIDGDAPRRQLTRLLAGGDTAGLLDILRGEVSDPLDVISPTSLENLSFLPAGTHPQNATELFGSDAMRLFLARLTDHNRFGIIVFDSAPVLVTSETPVLVRSAGQVVFVIRAEGTPRDAVETAVNRLECKVPLGLVLNRWQPTGFTERQYYGRYYTEEKPRGT